MKKLMMMTATLALTLAACAPKGKGYKPGSGGSGGDAEIVSRTPVRADGVIKMEFWPGQPSIQHPTSQVLIWTVENPGNWHYIGEYYVCLSGKNPQLRHYETDGVARSTDRIAELLERSAIEKKKISCDSKLERPIGVGPTTLILRYDDGSHKTLNLTDLSAKFRYHDEAMTTAEPLLETFYEVLNEFEKERDAIARRENSRCEEESP